MTDNTLVLSAENQQRITERADEIGKRSRDKGWFGLVGAVAMGATAGALAMVFPMAGLPLVLTYVAAGIGILAGSSAAANYMNAASMKGVKDDAKKEGFVSRMKERAERFGKYHNFADKMSSVGILGVIAASLVVAAVPAIAPIAALVKTASFVTWIGAGAVRNTLKPAKDSAAELDRAAEVHAPKDSLEAILKPSNESTLAKGAGPSNAFGVAVAPANDAKPEHKSRWKQALGF